MLTEAIDKAGLIVDGWMHVVVRKDDVEVLAARREAICSGCEHRRKLTCGLCGCPLVAKHRASDATCPIGRW